MAQAKKIEVEGKEYILSFPTRNDAQNAELLGFNLSLIESQPLVQTSRLFHAALLAKQSKITASMAAEISEKYEKEGGNMGEINSFLLQQYSAFFKPQAGGAKVKKAETIEI